MSIATSRPEPAAAAADAPHLDPALRAAYRAAPRTRRWSPTTVRAAWWAWHSMRRARRDLAVDGLAAVVPTPPRLPAGARRGVEAVLARTSPTCLERSLVLQAWLASHGLPCEVVIGVAREGTDVTAHAWLDVEGGGQVAQAFAEIHRLAAR